MISAPLASKAAFPPVWSPCQCVLIRKRGASPEISSILVRLAGAMSAYWLSMTNAPSGPVSRPMFPPRPCNMCSPSPRSSLVTTVAGATCCATGRAGAPWAFAIGVLAKARTARLDVTRIIRFPLQRSFRLTTIAGRGQSRFVERDRRGTFALCGKGSGGAPKRCSTTVFFPRGQSVPVFRVRWRESPKPRFGALSASPRRGVGLRERGISAPHGTSEPV